MNKPVIVLCPTCEGKGWAFAPKATIYGRTAHVVERCPDCNGRGRFPLSAGPGPAKGPTGR